MAQFSKLNGYVVTGPPSDRAQFSKLLAYAVVTDPGATVVAVEDPGLLPAAVGQMYPRVGAVPSAGVNATSIQGVAVSAAAPSVGQGLVFNGTAYAPATAGGGEVLIREDTLGAAQTSVVFDNIPQTFRHLRVVVLGRSTATNSGQWGEFYVRCNNDVNNANYFGQIHHGINTGTGANGTIPIGWITNANAPAGTVSACEVIVRYYRQTTWWKVMRGHSDVLPSSGQTPLTLVAGGGWRSTAAVTRIELQLNQAGQFAAGTIFALYGVP